MFGETLEEISGRIPISLAGMPPLSHEKSKFESLTTRQRNVNDLEKLILGTSAFSVLFFFT